MSQHKKLYDLSLWRNKLRPAQLRAEPLCVMCAELGQVTSASVVDHIKPHRGNLGLFADPSNLQSLCKQCHDSRKQAQERGGVVRFAFDATGKPIGYA